MAQEDSRQRANRELIELLNELRVALPGVQVLFAFLLTVPFAQGFAKVSDFQKDVYFVTLLLALVSSVLLIAPSAYHRLRFRQRDKAHMVIVSNRLTIAGLTTLALAMTGVVLLITDYLFSDTTAIVFTALSALLFALFWYALPLSRKYEKDGGD